MKLTERDLKMPVLEVLFRIIYLDNKEIQQTTKFIIIQKVYDYIKQENLSLIDYLLKTDTYHQGSDIIPIKDNYLRLVQELENNS